MIDFISNLSNASNSGKVQCSKLCENNCTKHCF